MILNKQIELPYHIAHKEEAMMRGINVLPKHSSKMSKQKLDAMTSSTFKAIAILIKFSDKTSYTLANYFDSLLYGTNGHTLRNYYNEVTHGSLDIVTVNFPSSIGWLDAPQPYSYYANGQNGFGPYPHNAQKLAEDAIAAANSVVDFSQYDIDADGYVDALFIIHAGPGAEFTGNVNDIWSHQWGTSTPQLVDGVYASVYSMEPEYWQSPGDMTCGVYAHEAGHAIFGLPDLYDYDNDSEGLGRWSLMSGGSWNGSYGDSPAHPDAWSLFQMGFANRINIISDTTNVSIPAVQDSGKIFRLWKNGSTSYEYFLVENRQNIGYDSFLPGSGLLIYHVDELRGDNNNQWYPGHTSSGHYKVALEQADGRWYLERNYGDDGGDPFPGSSNNKIFDNYSTPNSKDYNGKRTYVTVTNISNSSRVMTADFTVKVLPSEISVTPSSFVVSAGAGDTTYQTLAIHNKGLGDLEYQFPQLPQSKSNASISSSIPLGEALSKSIKQSPRTIDATGGPDSAGYLWADSDQPGGPLYNWVDISGVGTSVTLTYCRSSNFIPLGFDFEFYGKTFNQVAINSSGFISFTMNGAWIPWFTSLPSEFNPPNMIAVMANDLVPIGHCYYYQDTSNHCFIVEYQDWGRSGVNSPDYTMEILLYEDGRIVLQYQKVNGSQSGLVGIQNETRNIGITVLPHYPYLKRNFAIEFMSLPTWYSADPSIGTVNAGDSQTITLGFNPDKIAPGTYNRNIFITTNDPNNSLYQIPVTFTVFDQPNILIAVDTIDFGELLVDSIHTDTIIIKNKGSLTLYCNSIATDNSAFTVNQSSFSILPKNYLPLAVTFAPDHNGNVQCNLTVRNNDLQDSIVTIVLKGKGVFPPAMVLTPTSLNLSSHRGDTTITSFRISNAGLGDLHYDVSVGRDDYSIGDTITQLSAKWAIRGNIYSVKEPSTLGETKFFLDIKRSTELDFVIYRSDSKIGPFNRVITKIQSNSGIGKGFYTSGSINMKLIPGKYYFIAVTSRDSVTFYRQPRTLPIDSSFGYIYSSGLYYYIPPPLSISPTLSNTGVIYQTINFIKDYVSIISQTNGIVPPSSYTDVAVQLCSNGHLGTNHANINISTDDPISPHPVIPIELMIHFPGINIDAGWNMLAIPVKYSDYHKNHIFNTSESDAFFFNEGYIAKDSLQDGSGYWMKFSSTQTIYHEGGEIAVDTFNLNAKWNMIGTISYPVISSNITKIPPVSVLSDVMGYSNDKGYFSADTINPGYGYWLRSNNAGKIILNSDFSISTSSMISLPQVKKFAGSLINLKSAAEQGISSIVFSDAKGRKRVLYFATKQKQVDVTTYELPPPPPSNVFDVRFSSQRNIELLNESTQIFPIMMDGILSPLTVTWDVKEEPLFSSILINGKIIQMAGTGSAQITKLESGIKLRLSTASAIDLPKDFALQQNYPNPFNPSTIIKYQLPIDNRVAIKIYNMLGQEVVTLIDADQVAGYYEISWNASTIPTGVYFCQIHAGNFSAIKKMMLLK